MSRDPPPDSAWSLDRIADGVQRIADALERVEKQNNEELARAASFPARCLAQGPSTGAGFFHHCRLPLNHEGKHDFE